MNEVARPATDIDRAVDEAERLFVQSGQAKVRACHVDYAGGKGMATKVADKFAVPMCDGHHGEQHRGWKTFEAKYRINCLALSAEFWLRWPGRPAWERKNHPEGEI